MIILDYEKLGQIIVVQRKWLDMSTCVTKVKVGYALGNTLQFSQVNTGLRVGKCLWPYTFHVHFIL